MASKKKIETSQLTDADIAALQNQQDVVLVDTERHMKPERWDGLKHMQEAKQDVLVEPTDPHPAIMAHLGSVRALLSTTGHFEHNQCVALIDRCIELCEACEATDEP